MEIFSCMRSYSSTNLILSEGSSIFAASFDTSGNTIFISRPAGTNSHAPYKEDAFASSAKTDFISSTAFFVTRRPICSLKSFEISFITLRNLSVPIKLTSIQANSVSPFLKSSNSFAILNTSEEILSKASLNLLGSTRSVQS